MHRPRRSIRVSFGLLFGLLFGALLSALLGASGSEPNFIIAFFGLLAMAWTALS